MQKKKKIRCEVSARLPTRFGKFTAVAYSEVGHAKDPLHIALVKGKVAGKKNVLVRVHSECLIGEVFGSLRCDCREQLAEAIERVEKEESGVILYMRQEGRGIGLLNKMYSYRLQDTKGLDTVEAAKKMGFKADLRDYTFAAQILADLGLSTIRLLTNNPKKVAGLAKHGITVTKRLPLEVQPNAVNRGYLKTKKKKLGHLLFKI